MSTPGNDRVENVLSVKAIELRIHLGAIAEVMAAAD